MNEVEVDIDGEVQLWRLKASFETDCSVTKHESRKIINGIRVQAKHKDYQVSILISPNVGDPENSVDVYVEDIYCNVPNQSWKMTLADHIMAHLENVFEYCEALPEIDLLSVINKDQIYN